MVELLPPPGLAGAARSSPSLPSAWRLGKIVLLAAAAAGGSSATGLACNSAGPTFHDQEPSGSSLHHGYVGDGSAAACAAWCCQFDGCAAWSLRTDPPVPGANPGCAGLKPGQKCCLGWPRGRALVPQPKGGTVSGLIASKSQDTKPPAGFKPSPYLPPLLVFENGTRVETAEAWAERRSEVWRLAQTTFLGTVPDVAPPLTAHSVLNTTVAGDGVNCTFIELTFDTSKGGGGVPSVSFPIEIIHPTFPAAGDAGAKGRPLFLTQWNHRQWALAGVPRGYVGVIYPGSDAKDIAPAFQKAYPNHSMALIAARAFVGSRSLDYLLSPHFSSSVVKVNTLQVALTGHSRNGKQSLTFAALDERVTATVGSSPGVPIASPYHFSSENYYGESPRTGGVTCKGAKWWLCSSLQYDGHPENMPMDGHGVLGLCAPRACAIATAHADSCDYTFAGEMNIKEASTVYKLLGAEENLRNIYRYGQHHGFDDVTTYFDWFDKAFGIKTGYHSAINSKGLLTADSELQFPMTWLTPAGFDWSIWNASTVDFNRDPPPASAPLSDRMRWMLALGSGDKITGELSAFSMGSTYSEEGEGASYIPGLMYHHEDGEPLLDQQPFAFGDYLSAEALWLANSTVSPTKPTCLVIWLHPYSYNTGYSPQYSQADVRAPVAREAGCVVMAFDQVGFGIRVTQGGNKFYARHGGRASLLGQMVKDVHAAVDFMLCRSPALRHNLTVCSQHGYSVDNSPIDRIPYIDPEQVYVAGFALGGTVALHAAALDSRIKAVASFAGFTPMRTDTADKPTGGIRRLYEMHALLPRLGLFDNGETHNNVMASLPYDYEEVLSKAVAPRPTLLYTPQSDRDATWSDVSACVNASKAAWPGKMLTHLAPADAISKMEVVEVGALVAWLKAL